MDTRVTVPTPPVAQLTLLMGGRAHEAMPAGRGFLTPMLDGRYRIPVKRKTLGPQTVLLRPRWDRPAYPARVLPPMIIA